MYCIIDIETRSPANLQKVGAWNYSKHPETEILLARVWDSGSQSVRAWDTDPFDPPPDWFIQLVEEAGIWVAHNAFFEISLWRNSLQRVFPGLKCPPLEKWQDTQAVVLNWALPKSLEKSSAVLGREQKDKKGHALMLKMCKPRKPTRGNPTRYHWTLEDFARLGQYCDQDVIATKTLLDDLGALQKCERPVFELDKKINHRGFYIDLELAQAGYEIAQKLNAEAEKQLVELTNGEITTPNQHARFKNFAKKHGVKMASTDKSSVSELLKKDILPDVVRRVFEIRQALGKSSVAKYEKCLNTADPDDHRIRDAFVYHKAGPGRWAGQGFQPQNLPRGELELSDAALLDAIDAVKRRDIAYLRSIFENPMHVLSDLLRSVIMAPKGKKLIAADFSQVEARGALWLAEEKAAVEMLRTGGKLYEDMASTIFGIPASEVKKKSLERHVGKTAILGLGYGMGAAKFAAQAGIDMQLAVKTVAAYRRRFPGIPKLWRQLENAMRRTVAYKCVTSVNVVSGNHIKFYWKTPRVVAITLPSGREIHYWDPTVSHDGGIKYRTVSGTSGKWIRVDTWGGKILENVDQGMCSCLLRHSVLDLDNNDWVIIMTVHDEVVCEMPDDPKYNVDTMVEIMTRLPKWAKGFPLAATGWEGERFRK